MKKMTAMSLIVLLLGASLMPLAFPQGDAASPVVISLVGETTVGKENLDYDGTGSVTWGTMPDYTITDVSGKILFEGVSVNGYATCRVYDSTKTIVAEAENFPCFGQDFGVKADLGPGMYSVLVAGVSTGIVKTYDLEVKMEVTITFHSEGGHLFAPVKVNPLEKIGVNLASPASHPVSISNGTVTSYTFQGWYDNNGYSGDPWTVDTYPQQDTDLYAKWSVDPTTYDSRYSATLNLS